LPKAEILVHFLVVRANVEEFSLVLDAEARDRGLPSRRNGRMLAP
jgi:hypothetical protein